MKTFSANFTAEKNKPTGITPVWILECPFPSTGTIFISDRAIALAHWKGGITTLALVSDWGRINEDISGGDLVTTKVSDFNLDLIIDPNVSPNLKTILRTRANNIETTDCTLWLWLADLDDAVDSPEPFWVGNIVDFNQNGELLLKGSLVDQSVRINGYLGTKINLVDYPNADPDEVGQLENIIIGNVQNVKTRLLESGAVTSLKAGITAAQTDFYLSDGTGLVNGNVIQTDDEKILLLNISSNHITSCTRGYGGTTPAIHSRGSTAWEVISLPYVYEWAGHPVKSMGTIFASVQGVLVDITEDCTKYTGQPGASYTGYSGRYLNKAVITIDNLPSIQQKVDLAIHDPLTVNNGQTTDNITVNDDKLISDQKGAQDNISVTSAPTTKDHFPTGYSGAGWNNLVNLIDGSDVTKADFYINGGTATNIAEAQFPSTNYGTILTQYAYVTVSGQPPSGSVCYIRFGFGPWQAFNMPAGSNVMATFRAVSSGGTWNTPVNVYFSISPGGYTSMYVHEIRKVVEYYPTITKSGGVSLTGSITRPNAVTKAGGVSRQAADAVTMTGNSTANTVVGDAVLISGEGWPDLDGSVTGTVGALIERPDHVIKFLAWKYRNWPLSKFYTNADTQFPPFYKFAGVMTEYKNFKEWAALLAWQCRCYFRMSCDQMQLLWRPDTLTSLKTITSAMIQPNENNFSSLSLSRGPLADLINKIDIHYNRDWGASGKEPYQNMSSDRNLASVNAYGEKEKPELFNFDFVTDQAMADSVRNFYLNRYSTRPDLVTMALSLDNCELEFGDGLLITPMDSLLAEIQKVDFWPGSGVKKRLDRATVTVREYTPGTSIPYRLTEDGYYRLTEAGDKRIIDN